MGIIIKGMAMPKNCTDCLLFESTYHLHGCHAVPKSFEDMDMWNFVGDRPSWCPLIEVPPHGRLIDGDWLYRLVEADTENALGHTSFKDRVLLNIRGCRTIIKSEGEDG